MRVADPVNVLEIERRKWCKERVGTRVDPHGGSTIESTPPHLVVNSNTFIHSCVNPELEMVHPLSKHEIVERVSSNRIKTRMKMLNIQRNSKSRELKGKNPLG